jgi:hypothetical protein
MGSFDNDVMVSSTYSPRAKPGETNQFDIGQQSLDVAPDSVAPLRLTWQDAPNHDKIKGTLTIGDQTTEIKYVALSKADLDAIQPLTMGTELTSTEN